MRFLREPEDDVLAGSAVLRRSVIAEATAEIDRLDLNDAVEPRAAQRAAWLAVIALGMVVFLAIMTPSAAATALVRLMCPWGSAQWPRQNHLVFEHPVRRLASGQTFEVELKDADGARLPDDVYIQYRFDDSSAEVSERDAAGERRHAGQQGARHEAVRLSRLRRRRFFHAVDRFGNRRAAEG